MSEPKRLRDILKKMVDDPADEVGNTLRKLPDIDDILADPEVPPLEKDK